MILFYVLFLCVWSLLGDRTALVLENGFLKFSVCVTPLRDLYLPGLHSWSLKAPRWFRHRWSRWRCKTISLELPFHLLTRGGNHFLYLHVPKYWFCPSISWKVQSPDSLFEGAWVEISVLLLPSFAWPLPSESLCLSFLICKMRVVRKMKGVLNVMGLGTLPGT